ncbi:hypothetical protein [Rhizorhapis sp. SPR117]|uniref:hypothetical protein n=1 Tax=Rhizorhapis sp. SPR117 TaxID=2912611 RepID=UPI001F28D75A|nr:hypothetical protein [Rhizorhapis sp. SPR117]
MIKLTRAFIDKVKPPQGDYEIHWDDSVQGYGLRVTPKGKRVFELGPASFDELTAELRIGDIAKACSKQ